MDLKFKIYSWSFQNQKKNNQKPWYITYKINKDFYLTFKDCGPMLLDLLIWIKTKDSSITFRRSCREGICGSCAMNYNGTNILACITKLDLSTDLHIIHPLPHLPVLRDLVVNLNYFYLQHKNISPYLLRGGKINFNLLKWYHKKEIIHSRKNRLKLNGLYECILCACCSTSCPSYWWNQTEYLGPAVLLQSYRWLLDSRDINTFFRLFKLYNPFKVYRCHSILNCTKVCPKGLNPALSISQIKLQLDNLLVEKYFNL